MGQNPAAAWAKRKRESSSMGQGVEVAVAIKRARREAVIEAPLDQVIEVQVPASSCVPASSSVPAGSSNLESPLNEGSKGQEEDEREEGGEGKDAEISINLDIINRHLRSGAQAEPPAQDGDAASIQDIHDFDASTTKLANLVDQFGTLAKYSNFTQGHLSKIADLQKDVSKTKSKITRNLNRLIEEINTGGLPHDKQVEILGSLKLDVRNSSLIINQHVEESGNLVMRVKKAINLDRSWIAKCVESVDRKLSEFNITKDLGNGLEEVTHRDRIGSDDDYQDDENNHKGDSDDSLDDSIPTKHQRPRQKSRAKSPASSLKKEEEERKKEEQKKCNREKLEKWMSRSIVKAHEHWAKLEVHSPQRISSPATAQSWPMEGRSTGYRELGEPSSSDTDRVHRRKQQDVIVIDDQSDADTVEECTHTQLEYLSHSLPSSPSPLSTAYSLLDIHDQHTPPHHHLGDGLYCPSPTYPSQHPPHMKPTQQLGSDTRMYRVTTPAFSSRSCSNGYTSKSHAKPPQPEWTHPELVALFEGIEKFSGSKHKWAERLKNWDEMGDRGGKGKARDGAGGGGGGKGLLRERTVEQIRRMGREISREFSGAQGGESWVEIGKW